MKIKLWKMKDLPENGAENNELLIYLLFIG